MNTASIKADQLKPGMVLVDPMTGEPAAEIDHKMRTVRNSGNVTYLAVDLDSHRYTEISLRSTLKVQVIA